MFAPPPRVISSKKKPALTRVKVKRKSFKLKDDAGFARTLLLLETVKSCIPRAKGFSILFHVCSKGGSRVFHGYFKGVLRAFQGCFIIFSGFFKGILRMFQSLPRLF